MKTPRTLVYPKPGGTSPYGARIYRDVRGYYTLRVPLVDDILWKRVSGVQEGIDLLESGPLAQSIRERLADADADMRTPSGSALTPAMLADAEAAYRLLPPGASLREVVREYVRTIGTCRSLHSAEYAFRDFLARGKGREGGRFAASTAYSYRMSFSALGPHRYRPVGSLTPPLVMRSAGRLKAEMRRRFLGFIGSFSRFCVGAGYAPASFAPPKSSRTYRKAAQCHGKSTPNRK